MRVKKKVNDLRLLLTLEVFRGCRFKCEGCFVSVDRPVDIGESNLQKLSDTLDSFQRSGYHIEGIALGPTDFLVADNIEEVLTNPLMMEIINRFRFLSISTTAIDIRRLKEIVAIFSKYYTKQYYEINLIIEPSHILNDRYLDTLRKNRIEIIKHFDWTVDLRHYAKMNVFDYTRSKNKNILSNYDLIYERVEELIETTIDFNFSFGREEGLRTPSEFRKYVEVVKGLYDKGFRDTLEIDPEYLLYHSMEALTNKHYVWRDGIFYYTPLIYEDFISFKEKYKIPMVNGDVTDFDVYESRITDLQYEKIGNKTECQKCPLLSACIAKGTLYIMDEFGITDCPISKNWFKTYFDGIELLNN